MNKKIVGTIGVLSIIGVVIGLSFLLNKNKKVTINYLIDNEVIYSKQVIKDSNLGVSYIYESKDHQTYCDTWKDNNGVIYKEDTVINADVSLIGTLSNNLLLFTTEELDYAYANGINHVCSDKKVVIPEKYLDKNIRLGINAISNNTGIMELYLPATLEYIYGDNFLNCPNLTTIYFAGSEEIWNSIPNYSEIPTEITLTFNTQFIV